MNQIQKIFLSFLFFVCTQTSFSQTKIYPPNWWTGMKYNRIQLMLHGDQLQSFDKIELKYPGVSILKTTRPENKNYVFIDLQISPIAKAGKILIKLSTKNGKQENLTFEIKAKRKHNGKDYAQGVTSKDFMYLIMPDRYSNGDTTNDRITGMRDQSLRRDTVFNRHGGDLKGIQNHLDYLNDLGVTTLWLNPIWENDMPNRTEHGYAFTNHYKVDPRLGGNQAYKNLIDEAHQKGLKVVQDAVYNHVGSYHHTVTDPPMKEWLHQWDSFTNTNYKDQTLFDPYASALDKKKMVDGWFTREMPDLNQENPYVANFLIQHAIWSVEEFGIDGWRIDTYPYNNLEFMYRCNKALYDEYPKITLFGETWVHGVPNQSYFCENNYSIPYKSNLQATTDFQTLWGITAAMNEDFGWTSGVNKLYTTLAQDFVYKDPTRQVVFLDNHDMARFYSVVGESVDKYVSSICWLMTTRGIPQMYYSSEFATTGTTYPNDGYVRLDFPGGWANDTLNKFLEKDRNEKDKIIFNTWKKLAQFRKKSSALTTGAFKQFLPENGLYIYYRYDDNQRILVIMNTSKTTTSILQNKYAEACAGFKSYIDILNNRSGSLDELTINPYQTLILELKK
jgi:glycosidase